MKKFSSSRSSSSGCWLTFAWFFANFSLALLIKVLLIKKACTRKYGPEKTPYLDTFHAVEYANDHYLRTLWTMNYVNFFLSFCHDTLRVVYNGALNNLKSLFLKFPTSLIWIVYFSFRILTGKKHLKLKLKCLRKIRIWTFRLLVHQINSF